jgi:hypothetical protein
MLNSVDHGSITMLRVNFERMDEGDGGGGSGILCRVILTDITHVFTRYAS